MGHTHEDVDAMFGLVLSRVLHRRKFALPSELSVKLQFAMVPTFRAKGEICEAQLHTHSFDFGQWLARLGVELKGAFVARKGTQVPHSFILRKRRNLSISEAQAQALARWKANPHPLVMDPRPHNADTLKSWEVGAHPRVWKQINVI